MSKLIIHGPTASRALRVQWMAQELGIEFDQISFDFRDGSTRKPAYLAINRAGYVPAIQDGDFSMGESNAINIYLAKKHGKLMPTDLQGEAQVLEWCFWAMTAVEKPMLDHLIQNIFLPEDQRDAAASATAVEALQWPMTVIDKFLSENQWLVGDDFSVADLNVSAIFMWGRLSKLDMSGFPNLTEWSGRCLSRPSVPKR
jgi:glutathione S-transferase